MCRYLLGIVLLFSAIASQAQSDHEPSSGGALEAGKAAYNRGDYTQALRAWQPLAKAGQPDAQTRLGKFYELGEGVSLNATESASNRYVR